MAGELCAVLLWAVHLILDSTTVISVFLSMQYFTYFICNPIISSLCNTEHPPYLKFFIKKNEIKGLYTVFTFFYTVFTHLVVIITSLSYILTL